LSIIKARGAVDIDDNISISSNNITFNNNGGGDSWLVVVSAGSNQL
jgi:hypothetical protein